MSPFGVRQLEMLENVLKDAWREAESRKLPATREMMARRLFDAARAGVKDRQALLKCALGVPDDDEPFPPDLGMRPIPRPKPIWSLPREAA